MTYRRKLIEVALPLAVISEESARQKTMGAASHYQNLHRWWARRPSAAARAMLWASLVDDPSSRVAEFPTEESQSRERKRLFGILEKLIPWHAAFDDRVMSEAFQEILRSTDGELPKILDPFGGGGAIPLEAIRLGLPTFAGDLNPVAVILQKAMIEIPVRFADCQPVHPVATERQTHWTGTEGLKEDCFQYGKWMEEEARKRIGELFAPAESGGRLVSVSAYIWARTVVSPDPSWARNVPLVRSWKLASKGGKETVWIKAEIDRDKKSISYSIRTGDAAPDGNVGRSGAVCVATGTSIPFSYIRNEGQAGRLGADLIALVCDGEDQREYLSPDCIRNPEVERPNLAFLQVPLQGKATVNVANYGIRTWEQLYTNRQLVALKTFSDLLLEVRERIEKDAVNLADDGIRLRDGGRGRTAYADALVTYLAFVIDKCADFWSSICTWNSPNSQVRYTFSKQAIPMTWDFVEVNPFSQRMGSWHAMLQGVLKGIEVLPTKSAGSVEQRDARARIREVGKCVVSTDPPYYDNISYADLSDFFYVWMRENLADVWPSECSTLLTPKVEELIADAKRSGSKEAAKKHFELGMGGVFEEAAKNCDERFPATVFYAFKASESNEEGNVSTGWETFLSGLLSAGFVVTATWPVRTEFANKIGIAAGDNMLASSIVLACRKREKDAVIATRSEFARALRADMGRAIKVLQAENIAPVDMAQSAIGPGIAIFSRYSRVIEADGRTMSVRAALAIINEVLAEVLSGESSEFDSETRFAVTWFEQFGHSSGSFGDADTLAKAKNTSVVGVIDSGIAVSRDGRVRLLNHHELRAGWDPVTDSRVTVWEATHYLIRALEESELEAATLLSRLGEGFGDQARQLAYLLFDVCSRRKWASEGGAYNMLIAVWPDLDRMAKSLPDRPSSPSKLDAVELDLGFGEQ